MNYYYLHILSSILWHKVILPNENVKLRLMVDVNDPTREIAQSLDQILAS